MMIRAKINVKGRVQKAGYKDTVDEAAYYLDLKGYVKNLDDGTVEVVCEGEKKDIEELVEKVRVREYPIFVDSVKVEYSEATGEFKHFDIVREKDIVEATYDRMDMAARYMRNMHTETKDMHHDLKDGQDKMNQDMNKNLNQLNNTLTGFRDETKTEFQTIKTDYGKISQDLGKAVDSINTIAKSIEKLAEAIAKK